MAGIKIQHNKKLLYIILFLFIILILLVISLRNQTRKNMECILDSDCIRQQTTCCPCNSGGGEVCLNKKDADYYAKRLKSCPEDLNCIALYNCKVEKCVCINNKCQAVEVSE